MILGVFLLLYRLLWGLLLPVMLAYLWWRGRRDPLYRARIVERFGFYARPLPQRPIWFHAVSLGETRSATALIRLCLARGDNVVLTHFTPAGRRESARLFAEEMASGQLATIWVPFEILWCYRRFFRACRPRIGLTLEVEIWPVMVLASRRARIPLYLCNAQYPARSLARDGRGLRLRQRVMALYAGGFVKSGLQARRLAGVGLGNLHVTGELRFDQPIPPTLTAAAEAIRPRLGQRRVIAIASGVEVEEPLFARVILALKAASRKHGEQAPLFVYVPRAPERFDAVAGMLHDAGLCVLRRSAVFGQGSEGLASLPEGLANSDVLLGDSLGEMFFYLALSDVVVVGGSFNPRGAHNIIEPLMLGKPVLTGPHVWTIEYPFTEAEAAGVATSLPDEAALIRALSAPVAADEGRIAAFLAEHAGASERTLEAIDRVLARIEGAARPSPSRAAP